MPDNSLALAARGFLRLEVLRRTNSKAQDLWPDHRARHRLVRPYVGLDCQACRGPDTPRSAPPGPGPIDRSILTYAPVDSPDGSTLGRVVAERPRAHLPGRISTNSRDELRTDSMFATFGRASRSWATVTPG